MAGELHEIWRDDRLIEAAARGDLHHTEAADDPAVGPLCALAQVADARPLPRLDVDPADLVASPHNHRYAVRSLAVAVAAVATLSTSGVSAVVTGDPFRPAKAFWHEIQDHTVARSDTVDGGLGSGSAVGAPDGAEPVARAPETARDVAPVVSDASGRNGQTAHAPSQAPPEQPAATTPTPQDTATGETEQPDDPSAREATAEDQAATEESRTEGSTQDEPQQESTQEQQDDEESSDTEPRPPPEEDSDGDGLDPLVLPRAPSEDEGTVQPDPAQPGPALSEPLKSDPLQSDRARQPLLSEPPPTTDLEPTSPADEAADGGAAQDEQG
jgi:hypothetical protein